MNNPTNRYLSHESGEIQLFCFPYAGGSAALFKKWQDLVPSRYRIIPLEYPGRGKKYSQPLVNNIFTLIDQLLAEIAPLIRPPFAFFGHSLGAIIAYELSLRIASDYEPALLVLSGCPGPRNVKMQFGHLNDQQFLEKIKEINGTPEELLKDDSFIDFFYPFCATIFHC
jgi:medium-chain acyl-[acyl-carrier-protein] hydrolase